MALDDEAFVPVADASIESIPVYIPLNLRENYAYTASQIFGAPTPLSIAGRAAPDQIEKEPDGRGSTSQAYAMRFASHFGGVMVRENIALGVRALDGEDSRYHRSGKGEFWKRAGYAAGHTFAVPSAKGGLVPAWSMIADYSTPLIAQRWRPKGTLGGREMRAGSIGIGLAVTQNLYREFWPNVKKKVHR